MKFAGSIGFVKTVETAPDVWKTQPIERPAMGDIITFKRRWQSQNGSTNDDIKINQSISILAADPFIFDSIGAIRYVRWKGECWKVEDATPEYPRIIINLGGVYDGPTA